MSAKNYRPNYSGDTSSDNAPTVNLVDAKQIALERPWDAPPTCVIKFPQISNESAALLQRYNAERTKLDAYTVRCSRVEAGSIVEAACNKQRQSLQIEINDYLQALQSLNVSDRDRCNQYVASVPQSANAAVAWKKGLSCAVADIAERAGSLGPAGRTFAEQLRQDASAAQLNPPPVQDGDDVALSSLASSNMLSMQHKVGTGTGTSTAGVNDTQLVADILVTRHGSDGSVVISAVSALESVSRSRSDERTTILIVDRAGNIVGGEYTPAIRECLR
jgi:hypothetical protein